MKRLLFSFLIIQFLSVLMLSGQSALSISDLFQKQVDKSRTGQLNIVHNSEIDTLIRRHIVSNKNLYNTYGYYGREGFRIQIYNSSNRNAREESKTVNMDFINKFPDIKTYLQYAEPGYFKVRVGDFRTKTEATKLFLRISREFPNAYIVPDIINFPE
jgi:hypothetical protein